MPSSPTMSATNYFLPFFVVVSLFSFNQFGLLDLLGVRGVVQFLVNIPAVVFSAAIILPHIRKLLRGVLIRYLIVMLIMFALKQLEISMVWNLLFALAVGGAVLVGRDYFYKKTLEILIITLTAFSLMGILQWIIIQFDPSVVFDLAVFNATYLNNTESTIFSDSSSYGTPNAPGLRLLGLATGELYEFGPLTFPRLRSFLHEPSLAVAYFTLPGALALTYPGYMKRCGLIILMFSLLTLAASVLVIVPLALIALVILRVRRSNYAILLPAAIAIVFYIAVYLFVPPFNTVDLAGSSTFLLDMDSAVGLEDATDKALSNYKRLGFIAYGIYRALEQPIVGVAGVDLHAVLGMYLWSAVYGGIVGLIAVYFLFSSLFLLLWKAFQLRRKHGFWEWIPYVLICAIFIEAICINDFGFSVAYGLTMIALTYRRLEDLVKRGDSELKRDSVMTRV